MKFLKYLLILLAVLALIFFGRGLLTPSISYDSEITVDKSAAEAWAVMSDEENLPKWIDGFIRTELVSGQPNAIGSVSNVYVKEGEKEMMMTETITASKLNEHMGMKFSMDFMDMDYDMHFEEKDGKTHIKTTSKTTGNGLFAKSMVAFMKGGMKGQEDKNLNTLKTLINENTKNYFTEPEVMAEPIPVD